MSGVYRIDGMDTNAPVRADWHLGPDELHARTVRALAQWGGTDGKDLWVGSGTNFARVRHDRITLYTAPGNRWAAGALTLQPGHNSRGESVLLAGLTGDGIAEVKLDGSWSVEAATLACPKEPSTIFC